jgi:hypothetical protein
MAEPKNEELQFDVGENEEETTVEMNEDGTDAKVAEKEEPVVEQEAASEKKEQAAPDSGELDDYSDKVKKRIDKLTARLRETERREASALEYAKSVQSQHEELRKRYEQTATERAGEAKGRVETQITALKTVIKRAREEGDIDTETEAQQRLTQAIWEQQQLNKPQPEPVAQAQQPAPPPPQAQKAADPKAEDWAEKNPWFGQNIVMTNTVRGIHVELVKNERFDPTSDEYYDEIDRRMRNLFPQQFGEATPPQEEAAPDNRTNRPVQTVAPATRSSGVNNSARRTIKLKPSEVAIAKKLGVPLEEYAKHVKR